MAPVQLVLGEDAIFIPPGSFPALSIHTVALHAAERQVDAFRLGFLRNGFFFSGSFAFSTNKLGLAPLSRRLAAASRPFGDAIASSPCSTTSSMVPLASSSVVPLVFVRTFRVTEDWVASQRISAAPFIRPMARSQAAPMFLAAMV